MGWAGFEPAVVLPIDLQSTALVHSATTPMAALGIEPQVNGE
jgi:hypothetical protein